MKRARMEASSGAPAPQPEVSQSTMTNVMLQWQNGNLQTALQKARRIGADAEAQLATASSSLAARENALSVYERQWAQLEEQLSLLLAGVDGSAPAETASGGGADGLMQLGTAVPPLATDGSVLEERLASRVSRMQQLTRSLVAAAAAAAAGGGGGGGEGSALVSKLQAERAPLSAQVRIYSSLMPRAPLRVRWYDPRAQSSPLSS